jgi:hypothetical protein
MGSCVAQGKAENEGGGTARYKEHRFVANRSFSTSIPFDHSLQGHCDCSGRNHCADKKLLFLIGVRLQEGCRRREYILRSNALPQAKGPTIHEGDHSDGSVDVTDAIYCHCLLQIILRLPVRIGGRALLKIVLARKFPNLCISRRKPQNECHYQSENNEGCFLQSSYLRRVRRLRGTPTRDFAAVNLDHRARWAVDAEEVVRAVFAMLAARLPESKVESINTATSKSLHNLWPS